MLEHSSVGPKRFDSVSDWWDNERRADRNVD